MSPLKVIMLLLLLPLALRSGNSAVEARVPVSGEVLIDGRPLAGTAFGLFLKKAGPRGTRFNPTDALNLLRENCEWRAKEIAPTRGTIEYKSRPRRLLMTKPSSGTRLSGTPISGPPAWQVILIDKTTKDLRIQLSSDESPAAASSRDRLKPASEASKP